MDNENFADERILARCAPQKVFSLDDFYAERNMIAVFDKRSRLPW